MKNLGWIAAGGLGIGIVAATLAAMINTESDHSAWHGHNNWHWRDFGELRDALKHGDFSKIGACYDDGKEAGPAVPERRLSWTGGDSIAVAVPGTVRYRGGEGTEVIVRGDPEIVRTVRIRENRIEVTCDALRGSRELEITLPGRVFDEVAIAGSARMYMENIDQGHLDLSLGGSGAIYASGKADRVSTAIGGSGKMVFAGLTMQKLEVSLAGSGRVEGSGRSDKVEVNIAGSGNVSLGDMAVNEIEISIAGSGDVEAAPKDKAEISIMGSGKVTLFTHPAEVETNIMGSGKVIHSDRKASGEKET